MKMHTKPMGQVKKFFSSNRGESIVESIVSMAVLTLLIVTVTAMIRVAFKMTSMSEVSAKMTQEDVVNPVVRTDYMDADEDDEGIVSGEIIFSFNKGNEEEEEGGDEKAIKARHGVMLHDRDGIMAFSPRDTEEPEEEEPEEEDEP